MLAGLLGIGGGLVLVAALAWLLPPITLLLVLVYLTMENDAIDVIDEPSSASGR